MFKNQNLYTDFGMNSPISLNEIDESAQFRTFSAGETKVKSSKINKKGIRVIRVDLSPLTAKENIHVISIGYNAIKQKENALQPTLSKTPSESKQNICKSNVKRNIPRQPLKDHVHVRLKSNQLVNNSAYKSLSPFQRQVTVNAIRFSKD
ncbi:hypothetical protein SteCoe_11106 [Stentor coeruleus]|uniref:Uncharacterized protein n=1 Tax=Stentor coeruleus TaxID=5963 RepID=A0A1R2CDV8_9CILI|nr:hypothetical protein SteCoe_11106 [Stentor coeruleus]